MFSLYAIEDGKRSLVSFGSMYVVKAAMKILRDKFSGVYLVSQFSDTMLIVAGASFIRVYTIEEN